MFVHTIINLPLSTFMVILVLCKTPSANWGENFRNW